MKKSEKKVPGEKSSACAECAENTDRSAAKHSRYETARRILIFWCLFIGIGAVAGAVGMLSKPDGSALGMDAMLPYFQVLPFAKYVFQDFVFSGIALLCVNGLTNLTAAAFLLFRHHGRKAGYRLGGLFGVTLMMWICIQFVIFPMNFMSTSFFIFGLCQAATGYAAAVFDKQESFERECDARSATDYPDIGKNPKHLVVYFSRMGYTRRYALEAANAVGASIYEVKSTEKTEGTLGFWWCGRFGMHRWEMPIVPPDIDLSAYDHVTICSPVWVFHLSAPMRAFCRSAEKKIRAADYIIVHFQKCRYRNVIAEMDQLLGVKHTDAVSICCRFGQEKKRWITNQLR